MAATGYVTVGVLGQQWQVGTDNGNNSEFSPETATRMPPRAAPRPTMTIGTLAGTLSRPIGVGAANEATGSGSTTVGFERALTNADPTDRIHFKLVADQLDDNYQLLIDIVASNFTGGSIPIQVLVNGVTVHTQTITADGLVTYSGFQWCRGQLGDGRQRGRHHPHDTARGPARMFNSTTSA